MSKRGRRKGSLTIQESRKLGETRSKLLSVFIYYDPKTKQVTKDTKSEYGVRELSRIAKLPPSTVSHFIKHDNDFLIPNLTTGRYPKYRYSGVVRARDLATTTEEVEEQHVTLDRNMGSPRSDFRPMVRGSDVGQLRPSIVKVWRRKNKRVKGGYEIEGHEVAMHD